jgi:hypothetical protein
VAFSSFTGIFFLHPFSHEDRYPKTWSSVDFFSDDVERVIEVLYDVIDVFESH